MLNGILESRFSRSLLGICKLDIAFRDPLIVVGRCEIIVLISHSIAIDQELLLVAEVDFKYIRLLFEIEPPCSIYNRCIKAA